MSKQIIQTSQAPAPIGPYNQAVKVNGTLYISGQIAIDPSTNELIQGDVEKQAIQVMTNLEAILKEAGLGFENVVKSSIFLSSMNDFGVVNNIYGSKFSESTAPARETVAVSGLPKGVDVEISCIAIEF